MKNRTLILLGTILLVILLLVVMLILNNQNVVSNISIKTNDLNIKDTENDLELFSVEYSSEINIEIEKLISNDNYTFENVAVFLNPYNTNQLSGIVYFETEDELSYSYSIGEKGTTDYFDYENNDLNTNHYLQLFALMPGETNEITIRLYNAEGTEIKNGSFNLEVPELTTDGTVEQALEMTVSNNTDKLSNGLYFTMIHSKDPGGIYITDNSGKARGFIDFYGNSTVVYKTENDTLIFNPGKDSIVEMKLSGEIIKEVTLNEQIHHDFAITSDGNYITLPLDGGPITKNKDLIAEIDGTTGEQLNFLNMRELFEGYNFELNAGDWLHLNSVEIFNDNDIILSGRETSTIIKVSNWRTEPVIDYIIADSRYYELYNFDYESVMLEKIGDFPPIVGQHDVRVIENGDPNDGIYSLSLYNNFNGFTNNDTEDRIPYIDWSDTYLSFDNPESERLAYLYVIDVNENEGTYSLNKMIETVDSDIKSSNRLYEGNYIGMSANHYLEPDVASGVITEYDSEGNQLAQFEFATPTKCYRTIKLDF